MVQRTALIVIDMQQGLFTTPKHDAAGTVARINGLANRVRAADGSPQPGGRLAAEPRARGAS